MNNIYKKIEVESSELIQWQVIRALMFVQVKVWRQGWSAGVQWPSVVVVHSSCGVFKGLWQDGAVCFSVGELILCCYRMQYVVI